MIENRDRYTVYELINLHEYEFSVQDIPDSVIAFLSKSEIAKLRFHISHGLQNVFAEDLRRAYGNDNIKIADNVFNYVWDIYHSNIVDVINYYPELYDLVMQSVNESREET